MTRSRGFDAGEAYVFVRAGAAWTEQAQLRGESDPGDNFGESVAISGTTVVAGAHLDNTFLNVGAGSAFIYLNA